MPAVVGTDGVAGSPTQVAAMIHVPHGGFGYGHGMPKLASTEGIRWAFLKRTNVPHDAPPEQVLLIRWRVVQTPWFSVFVHKHLRPDPQRDLHDHPFSFVSLIVKGGYRELRHRASLPLLHVALSMRFMRATWPHSILDLVRVPTWTILFIGPRYRDWGFYTDAGWVHHKDYPARDTPLSEDAPLPLW